MSNSKWRFPNDIKMSINSTLVPLIHSSNVTSTYFLSHTKNFWCSPYYIFFFIEVIFTRRISWIHSCFCFQISFFTVEALQSLKWEKVSCLQLILFLVAERMLPGFSAFPHSEIWYQFIKMYLWLYKCCAFHLKHILQKWYIWM